MTVTSNTRTTTTIITAIENPTTKPTTTSNENDGLPPPTGGAGGDGGGIAGGVPTVGGDSVFGLLDPVNDDNVGASPFQVPVGGGGGSIVPTFEDQSSGGNNLPEAEFEFGASRVLESDLLNGGEEGRKSPMLAAGVAIAVLAIVLVVIGVAYIKQRGEHDGAVAKGIYIAADNNFPKYTRGR